MSYVFLTEHARKLVYEHAITTFEANMAAKACCGNPIPEQERIKSVDLIREFNNIGFRPWLAITESFTDGSTTNQEHGIVLGYDGAGRCIFWNTRPRMVALCSPMRQVPTTVVPKGSQMSDPCFGAHVFLESGLGLIGVLGLPKDDVKRSLNVAYGRQQVRADYATFDKVFESSDDYFQNPRVEDSARLVKLTAFVEDHMYWRHMRMAWNWGHAEDARELSELRSMRDAIKSKLSGDEKSGYELLVRENNKVKISKSFAECLRGVYRVINV